MNTDIIQDGFSAPLSDLIDKKLFEVFKVEGENRWVVRKIKPSMEREVLPFGPEKDEHIQGPNKKPKNG